MVFQEWILTLKSFDIQVSMCGAGRSNDNAYIERFWRTLKYEGVLLEHWQTPRELKEGIRRFIDWYNTQRPHQALGYQTPRSFLEAGKAPETSCPDGLVDKLEMASHLILPHNPTGPTATTTLIRPLHN